LVAEAAAAVAVAVAVSSIASFLFFDILVVGARDFSVD
jgi:hypothetical protein